MNLIEAWKSGRRFKRASEEDFYGLVDMADARGLIPLEDAVAEDYILEPEAKLFTQGEMYKAIHDALDKISYVDDISILLVNDARIVVAEDVSREIFKEG